MSSIDDSTWWGNTGLTSDNVTLTTSTGNFGNTLTFTANTSWDNYKNYDLWPKGVQDPSTEFKYTPKWHVLLGYKAQITSMWNNRSK